jgi:TRAP-type C4-dicarboxylate transport system substrate-binding protein
MRIRALTITAALWLAAWPAQAQDTLRAIGFIPKNDPVLAMANAWVNEINKELAGQLRINYVGGPEVVGRFQQIESVRNDIVQIVFSPANDYQDQMPASGALVLSRLSPAEERISGFYDLMVEEHAKKVGVRYIGRMQVSPFYLWVRKEAKTLDELKGLKMRSGVLYDRLMRELGMIPVTINAPEVFTAIDSGVVDGFGWPVTGPLKRGWLNKVPFVIDLPFFPASNVVALMNLKRWQALPKSAQDRIIAATEAFEPRMTAHFDKENEDEWKAIGNKVKKIKFSEAENKRYLDTAYELEWKQLGTRVPDMIQKLRKMSGN